MPEVVRSGLTPCEGDLSKWPMARTRPASPVRRLFGRPAAEAAAVLGVLPGEGVSPEIIDAALDVLRAVESVSPLRFEVRIGGTIGLAAEGECGRALSPAVVKFIREVFGCGGAVLAGAGGGRFVYEARREFDLFCKINPLLPHAALRGAGQLKAAHRADIDILIVRENTGGIYQGRWNLEQDAAGRREAHHSFSYTEHQVRRIVGVAARLAAVRRGGLTLVTKPHGVPTVSRLWSDCAHDAARDIGVRIRELEVDYATYLLVQEPRRFDVIVTTNLFGDILSDLGGVLLGSRGLCYGGSFSPTGDGMFQTNHGAAHDLAGTDRANPVGQILSLKMLLGDGLGLDWEADLVWAAVSDVWARAYRTDDLAEEGCRVVGTREMGARVADAVARLATAGA
jgi:3-isopropylmalate dehydrogenase